MVKIKKQGLRRTACLVLCAAMTLCLCIGFFGVSGAAADKQNNEVKLIPGGVPFGVKFNTEGVIVIGFTDIDEIS